MIKQAGFGAFIGCVAAASIWAGTAHGQASPTEPTASTPAGETLVVTPTTGDSAVVVPATNAEFDRGLAALAAGRNADAILAFQAAYAADGNPAALMNLGIPFTNDGKLNSAVESLTR